VEQHLGVYKGIQKRGAGAEKARVAKKKLRRMKL